MDLVSKVLDRRSRLHESLDRPVWIWEPVPDLCVPEELAHCLDALKVIDVISPNHAELCALFGEVPHKADGSINSETIETCTFKLVSSGIGKTYSGSVVVRCGKEGCFVAQRARTSWFPAYHETAERVVDPTGGGNAFLGAMGVSIARQAAEMRLHFGTICAAALAGNVGASYAIEQVGMPELSIGAEGQELWNGEAAELRYKALKARLEQTPQAEPLFGL